MFTAEGIARDRHRERLKQARRERLARQLAKLARLEKRRERAQRVLSRAWQRAERVLMTLGFSD